MQTMITIVDSYNFLELYSSKQVNIPELYWNSFFLVLLLACCCLARKVVSNTSTDLYRHMSAKRFDRHCNRITAESKRGDRHGDIL